MKRIRCQTCGAPLILSQDQKTAYCPGGQKNVSLENTDDQKPVTGGSYVQFMMDYGTISEAPHNRKSEQTGQEEDLLDSLSIGFSSAQPAVQKPAVNRQTSKPKGKSHTRKTKLPPRKRPDLDAAGKETVTKPEQDQAAVRAAHAKTAEAARSGKQEVQERQFRLMEEEAVLAEPVMEVSVQAQVPEAWARLEEKTEGFTRMDLDITPILEYAAQAFEQMDEAERALTVPAWKQYLQAWSRSSVQPFKDHVKSLRSSQERRKRKMTRRLEDLSHDLNDQRLANALDDEAYHHKLDDATAIRESAKRWSWLATGLLLVALVLFLVGHMLDQMLEGFYFYALVLEAAGIAGMAACIGVLVNELYRRRAAERDLSNLAAGREESDSEQKSIMVLSQAETEILRKEIRRCSRIMDACKTILSAKNRALEHALLAGALELSAVEAANSSDRLIRAIETISAKEEDQPDREQLATLSVFSFDEEDEADQ